MSHKVFIGVAGPTGGIALKMLKVSSCGLLCAILKKERSYYHDMLLKYSEVSAAPGTFTAGREAGPPLLGRGGAEVRLRLEEGRHLLERGEEPSSPGRMFAKLWHEGTGSVKGRVRSPCLAGLWGAWGREGDDSGK